ncbi:MAG: LacI family DNA-binding transcriptional regulator [Burkholderiales bacterium]|nr:LacI family DNA-binding transcriptional regulator [Opitutaceae bacterium]
MPETKLLDIARRLGVSKTTVSLALRGKPGLSEETVRRVLETAREMGYTPNPISSELMEIVRKNRHQEGSQVIAFINPYQNPKRIRRLAGIWDFVEGAKMRAITYGYRIEVFDAREPGMTDGRLSDILEARGIRGVLLGPTWGTEVQVALPWDKFFAVVLGVPESGPHLQRVCNHHHHGTYTALDVLASKGYRNVGVALVRRHELGTRYAYSLGAEQFRLEQRPGVNVTTWIYDVWNDDEARAWVEKNDLDAVVGLAYDDIITSLRTAAGASVGYANLAIWPGVPLSGIDQHPQSIGGAGVDLLRGLMLSGTRGIASRPQTLLVDGEWKEGSTTPGPGRTYPPVKYDSPDVA